MWKWAIAAVVVCWASVFSPSAAQQSDMDRAEQSADALREKGESEFWERRASVKRVEIWQSFRGNPPGEIAFNIDAETLIRRLAALGHNAVLINCDAYWSPAYDCEYSIVSNGRRNTLLISYNRSDGRKILRVGVAYLSPSALEFFSELVGLLLDDPARSEVLAYVRNQADPTKEKLDPLRYLDVRVKSDPSSITLYIKKYI